MKQIQHLKYLHFISSILIALFLSQMVFAQNKDELVRLAVIKVDTTQLDRYNEFLREEIEASIRLEPGVITLYGVAEKDNANHITLFETYADSRHYKSHLATPHFQKYKKGTLDMVNHLELIEMQTIIYLRKPELSTMDTRDMFIRLIKMEIDSSSIAAFRNLANNVMLPGIEKESGVLIMYALSEKNAPTHVTVLEVYPNRTSYENHLKTQHFLKYKRESEKMVRSLKLIDVSPILLGSKPQ